MEDVRDMLVLGTGKNIHMNPQAAQFLGQIADIDVHSARVFAAQGGQGTGMIRKHGNINHIRILRQF
jgi:hypothetical protein